MKNLILILIFCTLMTKTQASEGGLSTEFLDNDTVEFWVMDIGYESLKGQAN